MRRHGTRNGTREVPLRVLYMVYGFPPVRDSGTIRSDAFVKFLPLSGITPVVVCASDYPMVKCQYRREGSDGDFPGAEIHRMEWGIWREWKAMRRMRRMPLLASVAVRRASARIRRLVVPQAVRIARDKKVDVVFATSPPPETLEVAAAVARELGVPYVCDLRDPWTLYPGLRFGHVLDFAVERRIERLTLGGASRIVANTDASALALERALGLDSSRISTIPNGYIEEDFAHPVPDGILEAGRFNIVYTGSIGDATTGESRSRPWAKDLLGIDYSPVREDWGTRTPRHVVRALHLLEKRNPAAMGDIRLHFVGGYLDFVVKETLASAPRGSVVFHQPVGTAEAATLCAAADLLLLLQVETFAKAEPHCLVMPGKVFQYLRSGTPVLAPVQESDTARLLREHGAGDVCGPRDVDAIADAIERRWQLWKDGGPAPKRVPAGVERYERRASTLRLAEVLRAAAEDRAR